MEKLSKKQIILLIVIGILLIISIVVAVAISFKEETAVIDLNELIVNEETKNNVENNEPNNLEEENTIIVHITGEVKKTGVIKLKEGARIADAIKEAGGTTKEADIDEINLAYQLQDGQKIYIPNKNEKEKNQEKVYITSESGNNVIIQGSNEEKGGENKKVNINEASQSELESLPGIGESIASRIIEYREKNGKFQKIEDLKNVKGIGEAKYNNIKEKITVK